MKGSMMELFGLLVLVQIVSSPNGAMDVELTHLGLTPVAECQQAVADRAGQQPKASFTSDGKMVMSQSYQCILMSETVLTDAMANLSKSREAQKTFQKPLSERMEKLPAN